MNCRPPPPAPTPAQGRHAFTRMVEEHESMWLMSLHLRKGTGKDGVETKLQAACPRWCVWGRWPRALGREGV